MAELRSCPGCGTFYNYTGMREVCQKCAQSEEDLYQVVYRFLRKRENRAATVERIEEATGVDKDLLYKWVRKGRLHRTMFPNLGYPCDNCGHLTTSGKLCDNCQNDIRRDLRQFDAAKEFRQNMLKSEKATYHKDRK